MFTLFSRCLLIALLFSVQVIIQLHAAPNNYQKLFSMVNETTTAIPLFNVSTTSTSRFTPTGTTSIPRVTTAPGANKEFVTKDTFYSMTSTGAKIESSSASSIIPGSTGYQQGGGQSYFDTTTAAPPFVRPVTVYHEFDALSFMGGALLTICLVIIGTMVWKMYIAHVERRYWTL